MPTFGQHVTAQRLHLTGVGGLYALHNDAARVIKVLQPPEGIWSEDQLREEIHGFRGRAKTQKTVAQASKFWAPVHEVAALRAGTEGSSGGGEAMTQSGVGDFAPSGAYCVLDRYERSVRTLIDGRVALSNDDLRHLMSAVIRGLVDIRKIARRPHGNLKAANILLAQSANLSAAVVHLTDPAPEAALTKNSDAQDLAELGKILYELVNLRAFQGGTIGASKEWHRLGPNGEDWRKLCNSLLDAHAPPEERDLDKIAAAVETWTAKPRKSKAPILIAASVLLVLIVGGSLTWFLTRPPKLDFKPADWEKLCLSYYSWLGTGPNDRPGFLDHLADDATKARFSADPYPVYVVRILDAAKDLDKYRPQKLAQIPQSTEKLVITPSDAAKTGYAPYYTQEGVKLIDKLTDALTPASWPMLSRLDQTRKTYQERHWLKPAAGIGVIIKAAAPPSLPELPLPADVDARTKIVQQVPQVDVFAAIENTVKAAQAVPKIDAGWTRIQDLLKKLPTGAAADVPLIKALPDFAVNYPRSDAPANPSPDDVQELAVSFDKIERVLTDLSAGLAGQDIVYSALARDPAAQLPPDGKLTPDSFSGLPTLARAYVHLKTADDPTASADWNKRLDDLQKQFIDVIKEANPQDPNLPALISGREDLRKKVAAWDEPAVPRIEKNRKQLTDLVAVAGKSYSDLNANAEAWVAPYIIDPPVYIAQQKAKLSDANFPLAKATPVVLGEWRKAHGNLVAKVEAAPAELKKYQVYKAVDAKFKALQTIYADFDTKIPVDVQGLSAITGSDWPHTVAVRVATTYREEALRDLMTNAALKWSDDLPLVSDPDYQSFQQRRLAAFDTVRRSALDLIADAQALQARLDRLQLADNEPDKAPSWRSLYAKWFPAKQALLQDAAIAAALKPLADRVAALLALEGVNDYAALVGAASSPTPEIVLTAWRKLGAMSASQDLDVLGDEDKAESNLTALLQSLATSTPPRIDAARQAALVAEIKSQRPLRWKNWYRTLSAPSKIEDALGKWDSFGNPKFGDADLDGRIAFNYALYSLHGEFTRGASQPNLDQRETALKTYVTRTFLPAIAAARADDAVRQDKVLQKMFTDIDEATKESDVGSSKAGPECAGWEASKPSTGSWVFYYPSKASPRRTIEFARLPVAGKTVFVCTTEMSLGLFADAISGTNRSGPSAFADLNKAFPFKAQTDADGPRVWSLHGDAFVPNKDYETLGCCWVVPKPKAQNAYYPNGATPPPPTLDMPMQYVSPWQAMYVARLLGCRLPTSDEWTSAYTRYEVNNTAASKDAWNLRGDAWNRQFLYARDNNTVKQVNFPDAGTYFREERVWLNPPLKPQDANAIEKLAVPWTGADLLDPNKGRAPAARISPDSGPYKGSVLWFREVGKQPGSVAPGSGAGAMHDLVGNVAEFVFDAPDANAVVKDNAVTIKAVSDALAAARTAKRQDLFIIGGSSLSPPQTRFDDKQPVDLDFAKTTDGFSDVGFRLAFTAPKKTITEILAAAFENPPYLKPGPGGR